MTDEMDLAPVIKTWLKDTLPSSSESARVFDAVADQVPTTRQQRHPWPPLPTGRRRAAIPVITAGNELEPRPLATTSPTRGRALQPLVSVSSLVATGVIAALIGGFLLVAQPSGQQPEGMPGAATGGPGSFSPAGSLAQPRTGHTATLLPDGRVLIVGGSLDANSDRPLPSAEIWDPASASVAATSSLTRARRNHTATLLPDGRVLIVGGSLTNNDGNFSSAEIWDASTGSFAPSGSLAQARSNHTATLLPDGRVLVVGGVVDHREDELQVAEVWDPATATFSPAGAPAWEHHSHTATLLPDGRVLVIGGSKGGNETMAEVWDPTTASFAPAGQLHEGRRWHTATLLSDGRVLVVGGAGWLEKQRAQAEVWDPTTSTFGPAGSPTTARFEHTATLMPDGRILIVGGCCGEASAEIRDPASEIFGPAASLSTGRHGHTATPLADGRVLIVGGSGDDPEAIASVEVWAPSAE